MVWTAVGRSMADTSQIIYCANYSEIVRIKRLFVESGGRLESVHFTTPAQGSRGMDGVVLWDHYAIDVWERQELEKVRAHAARLRRDQSW
jgi:hypothetical protein